MMRPSFPGNCARASFQGRQPPLPNTPPPAFSHGTPPASVGGQFNGGSVSGWEGPAPALGVPVGGFNVQPEVLGLPAGALNGAIINNNQPWANLRADSAAWRDGAFSSQVGLHPFASGGIPSANVHPPFQNDQEKALHPMYRGPSNNHQQVGHIQPHNHFRPYQNAPQGQCVKPFEIQQTGSTTTSEQQGRSSNLVSHIYTGVPLGKFCSNSLSLGAQQQWPLPETGNHVATGVPAGNFHSSSSCRPNGLQQHCLLPDTANHIFTGVPAGNFNSSSPCKRSGALQQCPLPESANHVFNGVPAANFYGSLPCRSSGAPQQCPVPETSSHVFNGVPTANLYSTPLCRPSMNSVNSTNIEASVSGQYGSQQALHHAVNNVNTVSVYSRSNAPQMPSDSAGNPIKGQTNGLPMEILHMGTCRQKYDRGNNSWGRGRGENGNGMPHPQIRGGAGWRGGRNSQSNMVSIGRVGAVSFKCEACDRTFSDRQKMDSHKVFHVKCGENGCNFEAFGKLVTEHKLKMHGKKPASSANSHRAALILSKDGEEEIRRWREERRRNYPTTPNIQRKAQEALARKLRGELEDEDARIRKEVL
ncbi:hypothetical protein O6H91_06G081800 [Diphasiastrum complanatum]|uniref:Uncharacterized protein n=1 Tax=Diphasiastrum complanatum TaxID=34168 RepID=A0ACC2DFZ8_DIPCM|nr:hypothetical protein O6H91_06G081800 [Diphasiastrum complanatum]